MKSQQINARIDIMWLMLLFVFTKSNIYIYKKTKKKQCHHDPMGKRGERGQRVGGVWIERNKKKAKGGLYAKGDVCVGDFSTIR